MEKNEIIGKFYMRDSVVDINDSSELYTGSVWVSEFEFYHVSDRFMLHISR